MNLKSGFDLNKDNYIKYYKEYTFDSPILVSEKTNSELKQLGLIIYKSIKYLLENYKDFLDIMPRSERDQEIFKICSRYPYRVGTFRTDFVIDQSNQIKIIEITSRQPLNGYFTSGFFHEIAKEQAKRLGIPNTVDYYSRFFTYLQEYIGDVDHICVIKGNEKLEEIKFYPHIFENAGMPCRIIPLEDLDKNLEYLNNAWVIEELTFNEIRNLPLDIIESLARSPLHNNLLSLLHTHDKRFFSLLTKKEFTGNVLNGQEQNILDKYLVPTYQWNDPVEIWSDAKRNKDGYILKHQHKGKSVDIYAGLVTESSKWQSLLESPEIKNYILQPFIDQKRIKGTIGNQERYDYVAGTLLFFNDQYFGPGLFRTSSHPVTNIMDNRKVAQLVIKGIFSTKGYNCL